MIQACFDEIVIGSSSGFSQKLVNFGGEMASIFSKSFRSIAGASREKELRRRISALYRSTQNSKNSEVAQI
jgi:hypothetical protein